MNTPSPLFRILLGLFLFSPSLQAEALWVYFGTGGGDAKGIYVSHLDTGSGQLGKAALATEALRPGFLAIHPNKKYLYAVAPSIPDHEAKETGGVSAYRIDHSSGKLILINQQPSGGRGPCHVSLDSEGRVVLVANYSGGSCSSLGINEDGSLKKPTGFIQHEGSSVNTKRQQRPHAHSANPGPHDRFAFVADLGLDKVLVHKLDAETATMTNHSAGPVPPGSGPRHFAFHPNGKWAYTNGEMLMNVTGFSFDPQAGTLIPFQTIDTIPKDTDLSGLSTAEIQVHKSGKFLYVSNRGHDTITVFSINPENGRLSFIEREPVRVEIPRNFGIDPSGRYLIAAGQKSHNATLFKINQQTGELDFTGETIDVPSPICVKFLSVE